VKSSSQPNRKFAADSASKKSKKTGLKNLEKKMKNFQPTGNQPFEKFVNGSVLKFDELKFFFKKSKFNF
jgi:hypothetical protein